MASNAPQNTTWISLDTALRSVERLYASALADLNLTTIEAHVLRSLYNQDRQRPGDLARAVGRPPTSFTPILDKLEKAGLIERQHDPADRRALRVYLTDKGKGLRGQIETIFKQVDSELHQRLPAQELETLDKLLQELLERQQ